MRSNILLLTLTFSFILHSKALSQDFEGRLSYTNYKVVETDTIESSRMNYWIKEHLYKHTGQVTNMPLFDLGTLYADADKMSRTNLLNSTVERIKMPLDATIPNLRVEATDEKEIVLDFSCQVWNLIDNETDQLVSRLWIADEIVNANFDQFVELFNYGNTLFPCKGINGWVLKREDYRREGEIFVSEALEVKQIEINMAEMVVY